MFYSKIICLTGRIIVMRKIFLLAITAIMLLCPLTASASRSVFNTEGTLFVVKCNNYISLRSYASTSAPVLAHIPLGAEVYVIDGAGDFAYVRYNGMTGYALYSYLSPSATLYTVVNCREWVSLRSAPDSSSARITTVPLGADVRFVRSAGNGFSYVYYRGSLGYIMNDYLY